MATAEQNIQTVHTVFDCFGRGDMPGVLEHIADDMTFWGVLSEDAETRATIPWHEPLRRKQDVPKFFQALGAHCQFARFEPAAFVGDENYVYCSVSFEVTVKGKTYTYDHEFHRFSFNREGRITAWHGSEDTARILTAMRG